MWYEMNSFASLTQYFIICFEICSIKLNKYEFYPIQILWQITYDWNNCYEI